MRVTRCISFLTLLIVGLSATAGASPINLGSYSTLLPGLIDFENLTANNYDVTTRSGLATFSEHFLGQTVTFTNDLYLTPHDVLSGSPGNPLTLEDGAANKNLEVVSFGSNVLAGLGDLAFGDLNASGEGAMSILFDFDQSSLGFELLGADGTDSSLSRGLSGQLRLDFFRRDGSLIDTVYLQDPVDGFYGFDRDLGLKDIAGVSVSNTDFGGLGIDNIRHDVISASEPTSILLLGPSLFGLAFAVRRKIQLRGR